MLLIRFEWLAANCLGTLAAVYDAIGETLFAYDPGHIEPAYDMIEFDVRLGKPRLHDMRGSVRAEKRPTILPPDLFAGFEKDAFWEDPAQLPPAVRVV
jgi:sulfotransferase